ncbi:MAG: hypothetical protein FRX48_05932 [Lasallia pustulata]|uniref:Ribosomal protein S36, mitochondrial n=1 Tax=Lasallia pustulata TaxID=136370 RepID=A0A5M8PNJ1_9LECA|nr:MAG: hypothetical protein FRX48_05932 [Lasallia pustulata]
MHASRVLRAAQHRTPMIKFLGRRSAPKQADHTPHVHPASPTESLPDSFANYRSKAQQHGPLGGQASASPSSPPSSALAMPYGAIGGQPGRKLGPVEPPKGQYFDRSELPKRFRRTPWTQAEIEALETGGASMFG